NSNIIAARVARETFGVGHVVARIYDPLRAEVYERLGIPTIATVPWTANRLLKNIMGGTIDEEWRDPTGQVVMLHVVLAEDWVGQKVTSFEQATGAPVACSKLVTFWPTQSSASTTCSITTCPVGSRHSSSMVPPMMFLSSRLAVHGTVAMVGMPSRS